MRKLWLTIHLYLGLVVGLIFVLAGLTGSLLVFYIEIDQFLNPSNLVTSSTTPHASLEDIFQALRKAHPQRDKAWRIEVPDDPAAIVSARYYKPPEKEHLHFAPLIAWVNPYTVEVTRSDFWGDFLMTWIYDLHFSLLLDEFGKLIMGIIGIFLLVSIITGVYLWWPKTGKWQNALTMKRRASFERFNYDLHKINGVYGFIVILMILITGVVLDLPDYTKPLIGKLSPLYQTPVVKSQPAKNQKRITLDKAVEIAQQKFPNTQVKWVETPDSPTGVYRINLRQPGEPSPRFPKTNVWIEQYSGAVLALRDARQDSAGDIFLNWLHPLHSGEAFSMPGRIIVLVSGFVPLVLYVTGFVRWRQKVRYR